MSTKFKVLLVVLVSAACVVCAHAQTNRAASPAAPSLVDVGAELDLFATQLIGTIENRRGAMPFAQLKAEIQPVFSSAPAVLRSIESLAALEARKAEASARYLPQIRANAGLGSQRFSYAPDGRSSQQSLTASQLLYDFGATGSAVAASAESVRSGTWRARLGRSEVLLTMIKARAELRRASQRLELAAAFLEGRRQFLERVRQKNALGASSDADIIRAESKVFEAADELPFAVRRLDEARARFREIYGIEPPEGKAFSLPDMPASATKDIDQVIGELSAVRELQASAASAEHEYDAAKAKLYGSISLEGSVSQSENTFVGRRGDQLLQLTYRAEVYTGGAQSAQISQAAARHNEIRWELERVRREHRRKLEETQLTYTAQRASIVSRVSVVRSAKLASDITKELFSYSRASLTDVFKVQEDYLLAARNLVDSETELQISFYEMLHAFDALLDLFEISI